MPITFYSPEISSGIGRSIFPGGRNSTNNVQQSATATGTVRGMGYGLGGSSTMSGGAKANTDGKLYGGGAGGAWANTNTRRNGNNGANGVILQLCLI